MIMPDATARCVGHIEVIYMKLPPKERRLFGAVWLWCITQGYTDVSTPDDWDFTKAGEIIRFIPASEMSYPALSLRIARAKEQCDHMYVVINDSSQCDNIAKHIPAFCGIFCNDNPFGLGQTVRILRVPSSD